MSLLGGVEVAEVVLDIANVEASPPLLPRLKEANTFEPAGPVGLGPSVAVVLGAGSQSQVVPSVVGAATINVVNLLVAGVLTRYPHPHQSMGPIGLLADANV